MTSFFITAWWEKINDSPQPRWKKLANRRFVGLATICTFHWTGRVAYRYGVSFSCASNILYLHSSSGGEISSKGVLLAQQLPDFIEASVIFYINSFLFWNNVNSPDIISRIKSTGAFEGSPHKGPNHIILNEVMILQHCVFFISLIYNSVPPRSRNNGTSILEKIYLRLLCLTSVLATWRWSTISSSRCNYISRITCSFSLFSVSVGKRWFRIWPHFSWRRQEHQYITCPIHSPRTS